MSRRLFSRRFRLPVLAVILLGVASCTGVEIVGGNETNVWIKNPFLSIGGSDDLAQKHCSIYGKTAVLESDLAVGDGTNSILVYACE